MIIIIRLIARYCFRRMPIRQRYKNRGAIPCGHEIHVHTGLKINADNYLPIILYYCDANDMIYYGLSKNSLVEKNVAEKKRFFFF